MNDKNIAAIILAAGGSKRMGFPKALLAWRGKTFLNSLIDLASETHLRPIVVVLGSQSKRIRKSITSKSTDLIILTNKNWKYGQASSLIIGVNFLEDKKIEGTIIFLVDQPQVDKGHVESLIDSFYTSKKPIVITENREKLTPPTFIHRDLFKRIFQLKGDEGARSLLSEFDHEKIKSDIDLLDIDTTEEYAEFVKL